MFKRARHTIALVAATTILCFAGPALANHFLLELEGGFASPSGVDAEVQTGDALAGTFGIGGRVRGFAPAYYLIARVGSSQFGLEGPASSGRPSLYRDQTEVVVGGRVYLPITQRLRFMAQLGVGEIHDESTISRAGHRTLVLENDAWGLFTEAGLQYRLTNNFSLGASVDLAWVDQTESLDLPLYVAGIETSGELARSRTSLTATFHF